jgi:excisionase family DNA binding protein
VRIERSREESGMADVRRSTTERLSAQQTARVLGVSVFMVRSLLRQRRLAYHRVGRRIVIDAADIEQFLRRHRVEARAE